MVFFQIPPISLRAKPHVDSLGWKEETEKEGRSKKHCDDDEGEPEIEGLVHTHVLSQALKKKACSSLVLIFAFSLKRSLSFSN